MAEKRFYDCHCHIYNINHIPLTLQFERFLNLIFVAIPLVKIIPFSSIILSAVFFSYYKYIKKAADVFEMDIDMIIKIMADDLNQIKKLNGYKKILIPLLMDFEYVKPQEKLTTQIKDTKEGIEKFRNIAGYENIDIRPFLGINPHRFDKIEKLDKFLNNEMSNFIGIKLYPPLLFDPFPDKNSTKGKLVYRLYDYCIDNDVPITIHCGKGGFIAGEKGRKDGVIKSKKQSKNNTNPKRWELFLGINNTYRNIRLNFAHFGDLDYNWSRTIIKLIKKYPNTYTDISYIITNKAKLKKLLRIINNDRKGKYNKWGTYKIEDKILFGSDFSVVLFVVESYKKYVEGIVDNIDKGLFEKFTCINPERFLRV